MQFHCNGEMKEIQLLNQNFLVLSQSSGAVSQCYPASHLPPCSRLQRKTTPPIEAGRHTVVRR